MRHPIAIAVLLFALVAPTFGASPVVISEFMASNSRTLADEDGQYPDWIELFNTTTNTVNLNGWHLTDTAGLLTKWRFPATNIAPHGFMIVFVSGKDRRVPGAPLHANFSLNASGEYLALVESNGVTIASEFAPEFVEQFTDVAYGFPMNGNTSTLIPAGAAVTALIPSGSIGTTWRDRVFDDSGWTPGMTGAGFDQTTNYGPAIALNLGSAMSNVNATAYLRVPFTITNAEALKALTLRMRYDDGFVAYLNGTEIARRNAPASPVWNSQATANHGAPPATALVENFEGAALNYTLNQYGTAPAPVVQAPGAGSTGSYLRLLNDAVNSQFNSVTFRQPGPGLFETITASFDFRLADAAGDPADGFAFMLIPTNVYGTNGPGISVQPAGAIEEPNYPGVFSVGFDVYPHGSQNDVSVHWNGSELRNITIPRATLDLVSNQFHRVTVTLKHVTGGARATVTFVGNINGVPGAAYTPITNLFIAGLNPYECRAQIAGRTGGADLSLDLDNVSLQFQPFTGLIAAEEIDISAFVSLLTPGTNLLAIQGLNLSASDSDFLIVPELTGSDFTLSGAPNHIAPPTPGSWNNVTGAGTTPPVTFSPPAGLYYNSVTVALASASSSAEIRYTIDGSAPTATSLLYSNPLVLSANTAVRARAYESGRIDSGLSAASYIVIDNTLTNFSSNLPLIFVDTLGAGVVADTKNPGYGVFIDTNATRPRVSFSSPVDYSGRLGIEYHGQSSLGFPKKSYNVEIDSELDNDKRVSLLGLPRGADWVLYAPYTDKTLMNDVLTYTLHEAMGNYAVRRKYIELFVRSSAGRMGFGDYQGVYVLLEKIRVDENRVDIRTPQSGTTNDPITGGYIWKRDKGGTTNDNFFTTSRQLSTDPLGEALRYHDPKYSDLSAIQRAWLTNHLNEFENVLYGANWRDPVNGYAKYIDVRSYVDHHWAVEFPKNIDGIRLSNYLQKDRGGKIKEKPLWDWNLAWGNANYLEGGLTNNWYWPQLGEAQDMYFRRLRADPDFNQMLIDRWGEMRTNIYALSNLLGRVDGFTNLLNEAQSRDHVKWPRLNGYVWPNPDGTNLVSTDGTTATWHVNYATPGTYSTLIGQMKYWITGRHAWIDAQFLKAPWVSRDSGPILPGAPVTMSNTIGAIYYTLDGTDPRASNGVISAAARVYTNALTLTNNAGLFARALWNTTNWSPPSRAVYVLTTPAHRITEVMYHPANPPTNSLYSENDFEFVEIQNTGTNAINLLNCQLDGGIQFKFPAGTLAPGSFALVVRNRAAFLTRYASNALIAGEFTGQLNNAGDHVILLGPYGEPIHEFNFGDNWYPASDGHGFSLVTRSASGALANWNDSTGWRQSAALNGSPGTNDAGAELPPVIVNEILANSVLPAVDWIELFNPTTTNVNVGGWFLSDSFSTPKKFRIPDNTIILPGGFVSFNEVQFNLTPGATNSFALRAEGDDVWLFSADVAGNLTGYANGFDFGASEEAVTIGRHVASDGDEDFVALVTATRDATNSAPLVGPVVVSEIMYHPPDINGADDQFNEFIELQNISAGNVALFSGVYPDKTWRLRNAVDFDFPTNVTLAIGERVLVVAFDPAAGTNLAAFRAKYSVDPGIRVFGPYSGKLDNSGERIELHRPGTPTTNGLPYLLVEKVAYSHTTPWNPAADGTGLSLQRVNPAAYGNDPANWTATFPTAGAALPAGSLPGIVTQPAGFNVIAGANTNLSVVATGALLRYQWIRNGNPLAGATNATLLLTNLQAAQAGTYIVAVYTPSGGILSDPALVSVIIPVTIAVQPLSQAGPPGTNVTFSVIASGTGTLTYQWFFNGTNIAGATSSSLAITNASLANHGNYTVRISDEVSWIESIPASLYVMVKPGIHVAPVSATVVQGANVTVSGVITGAWPLSLRWFVNNVTTTNLIATNFPWNVAFVRGGTNTMMVTMSPSGFTCFSTITMTNLQANATFRMVTTNFASGGVNVQSSTATITVLKDSDGDGVPDVWESAHGMITNNASDGLLDFDNDGMINRDEYFAGTSPTNAASVLKVFLTQTNLAAPLQFDAQSNITYTIQYRTNLDAAPWQTLSNVAPQAAVRTIQFASPPETTNNPRYFRVLVPPAP